MLLPDKLPSCAVSVIGKRRIGGMGMGQPGTLYFSCLRLGRAFKLSLRARIMTRGRRRVPTRDGIVSLRRLGRGRLPFRWARLGELGRVRKWRFGARVTGGGHGGQEGGFR